MAKFYHILEIYSKYVFCTEISYGDEEAISDDNNSKYFDQVLKYVSTSLEVIDIINLILDLVFVVTKLFMDEKGEHVGKGVTMLIGLTLARLVARQGHILKDKGGIQRWVPFCQTNKSYRQSKQSELQSDEGDVINSRPNFLTNPTDVSRKKRKETVLQILYCITFTELAVFFLEDATMIFIWVSTAEFDPEDKWDMFNSWMTIVSALSAMVLLLLSMFYSMTSLFSFHSQPLKERKQQSEKSWARRICCCWLIFIQLLVTFICRIIRASLFITFFLIFIIGYFLFLIWLTINVIHKGFITSPIKLQGTFYFIVGIAWAIAFYFVSKLLSSQFCCRRRYDYDPQLPQIDSDNNHNEISHDESNKRNNDDHPGTDGSIHDGDNNDTSFNNVDDTGSESFSVHSNNNDDDIDDHSVDGVDYCINVKSDSSSEHSFHNEMEICNGDEETKSHKSTSSSTKENLIIQENNINEIVLNIEEVKQDQESNDYDHNFACVENYSQDNDQTNNNDEDTDMQKNNLSFRNMTMEEQCKIEENFLPISDSIVPLYDDSDEVYEKEECVKSLSSNKIQTIYHETNENLERKGNATEIVKNNSDIDIV